MEGGYISRITTSKESIITFLTISCPLSFQLAQRVYMFSFSGRIIKRNKENETDSCFVKRRFYIKYSTGITRKCKIYQEISETSNDI